MTTLPPEIFARLVETHGRFVHGLAGIPPEKGARDVLDEKKVHDQMAVFCHAFRVQSEDLRGKRLIEVGSGFGVLISVLRRDYGIEAHGVEPAGVGFESSFQLGREIVRHYGHDPAILHDAAGESLPFPDESFDLVFSSTVLEHTQDPPRVLAEAIRVLRPGGLMQFVYPNYGGFFDGHYVVPWIPYQPHWLARLWLRLWRRDPAFVDTLQFTNYFKTRRWLRDRTDIEIVSLGEETFRERMRSLNFGTWAGLGRLKTWVQVAHSLRVVGVVTWLMLRTRSFEPIILSLRKKGPAAAPIQGKVG